MKISAPALSTFYLASSFIIQKYQRQKQPQNPPEPQVPAGPIRANKRKKKKAHYFFLTTHTTQMLMFSSSKQSFQCFCQFHPCLCSDLPLCTQLTAYYSPRALKYSPAVRLAITPLIIVALLDRFPAQEVDIA
jgi:hypothetical protein